MDESAEHWHERWQRERAARLALDQMLREASARPHTDLLRPLAEVDPSLEGRQRDFLDVVSHELRTPLTILNGSLHILNKLGGITTQQQQVLGTATRAAERLVRIVQNVETWTNLQSPYHQWSGVTLDMERLLVAVTESAAPDHGALMEVGADTSVAASGDLLFHCLANLVHNAVTYGKPPIVLRVARLEGGVEVSVTDAGSGLPEASSDLFAAFAQGDAGERRTSTGIGLGLSIVMCAARRFGWQLTHERDQATSSFRLLLPPHDVSIAIDEVQDGRERVAPRNSQAGQ